MKLTYIANIRLPTERAHGIQIMSMAEAFADAGAEVTLAVSKRKTAITEDPFAFYGIKKNFKLERLSAFDLTHYGHIFRAFAYHLERLTFTRSAVAYAKKNPADIFYTRDELTFIRFAKNNLPVVYEMHSLSNKLSFYTEAFKRAKKIIVISSGLKEALVKHGVAENKILIAHDGVDLAKFSTDISKEKAREKFSISRDAFVALYAGLLDEWKGYHTLLESSHEMRRENVNVVIAGGKPEHIQELARKYPDVQFIGFRKYEEMPALHKAADVIIIPNSAKFDISRLYTSPLKLFQAMASGVPIAASDIPSLKEILSEKTAFFFSPDNPTSLAQAVISIKNRYSEALAKAQTAHDDVRQYSWLARAKAIISTLND
jgi:glycosyltransferase involved in cell wall biosynthesis